MLLRGWLCGLAVLALTSVAVGEQDLRPGVALPPGQPTPEAAHYEALLQDQPVLQAEDSVAKKQRRFDQHALRLGVGLAQGTASLLVALYTEVDAAQRVTLGSEVGVSVWGLLAGGYVRARPSIWGGQGRRALHALTLEAGYRYMQYGDGHFGNSSSEQVEFLSQPQHFLSLSAGFEHDFASRWILRYALGVGAAPQESRWHCERGGEPVTCDGVSPPPSRHFFLSLVLSRTVF